ncbi:MAG: hypothetical protein ACLPUO_07800 [Streptosporangiaceae bacterium]|jgi:hypothetical protein
MAGRNPDLPAALPGAIRAGPRQACYLLASASLRFTVPGGRLPRPPAGPRDARHLLVDTAQRAVRELAGELSRVVCPVIETLERS